jgi:hypothetical protein
VRLFVLGAPCGGKSTVTTCLRRRGIDVSDADDEIVRLNGGVWPDIETMNERFLPRVLDIAGSKPEVVLFNSSMPLDRTRQHRDRGFVVVLLDVSEEKLRRRDRVRLAAEGWTNIEWFDWHQSVIREHHEAGLIDGERDPDEIAAELIASIRAIPRRSFSRLRAIPFTPRSRCSSGAFEAVISAPFGAPVRGGLRTRPKNGAPARTGGP